MYFFELKRHAPPKTAEDLAQRLTRRREKWHKLLTNLYTKPYEDSENDRILIGSFVHNAPQIRNIDFFLDLIA